jgi:hypothetical protein
MRAHLKYARYVFIHKWYVFWAAIRLGVPFWRALIHDYTKFSRTEWGPYVRRFYAPDAHKEPDGSKGYFHHAGASEEFDAAWTHHWQHNPHHWQFWITRHRTGWELEDELGIPQDIPETYVREMVADWIGAGKAQGKPDIEAWYLANKDTIQLHDRTRALVTHIITEAQRKELIVSSGVEDRDGRHTVS